MVNLEKCVPSLKSSRGGALCGSSGPEGIVHICHSQSWLFLYLKVLGVSERLPNIKDIKEVNFYNPDAFFITVTTSAAAS